ncbi:Cytochrome c oxidase polypeptide I+III [Bremerella volcania]|uniref:Cytochrome c oxidase polypeptide I+III n=1 Tax=Bremerella volcania TaxID=2527984 RepID=A0A518CBX7_9BACT|nr:cbb3-type cytochrome c oxidase subunit I [Bremerella volcania]QDU76729.1 Cytochrome c oxidase polypeptide I+III [Bremerella volcania]
MSTITPETHIDSGHNDDPSSNYLTSSSGFMSWAFTLDHKRIGVMYLVGIFAAFFLGGVLALLLRLHLMVPNGLFGDWVSLNSYNQLFTLHGAVMIFLFIIPSVPAALGNFVLPLMVGAKDVAFPRMNLASFHLWVFGAIFFLIALVTTGLDTGWTFYTPYSIETQTNVIAATIGAFILGFSSIFTGLNFIVTVNTMRPPGMTWFKMPLFMWAIYATAIIQILATPVLGITLLLLMGERILGIGIFDPSMGGDPVLFQHFFWFYSHPAVYIMILPAMGIISELMSVYSRKPIFGYTFIAYSSIAIALLGFLVWGHHMFVSGQSPMAAVIFSGLTFSVSIPSAIKVFNWTATMYKGNINLATPMCYALSFIFLFTIGGLTGLFLGALATDVHLHDTYFVVAHFHYVMMGGTVIAFVGGLYHWWPKMFGVMYNEFFGRLFCAVVFFGFNLTFLPQFVMGSRGMPRRYATYVDEYQIYHVLSTIGALALGIGMVGAIAVLVISLFNGRKAPANPWGAATLEWTCTSPPPYYNFEHAPHVDSPYDYSGLKYDPQIGGYVKDPNAPKPAAGHH